MRSVQSRALGGVGEFLWERGDPSGQELGARGRLDGERERAEMRGGEGADGRQLCAGP